jgi:recombination protein RecT
MAERNQQQNGNRPPARQTGVDAIKSYFGREDVHQALKAVAAKHVNAERLMRLATSVASRNQDIAECTPRSILMALVCAAQLDLDIGGVTGEGYLVAYNTKIKGKNGEPDRFEKTCTFIPGSKGLVKLALRTERLAGVPMVGTVREGDTFEYEEGPLGPHFRHVPRWAEGDKAITHVWCRLVFQNGPPLIMVMPVWKVQIIKSKSKAGSYGPWVDWFEAMAWKTVIKQALRTLPLSEALDRALRTDDVDEGIGALEDVIDVDGHTIPDDEPAPAVSQRRQAVQQNALPERAGGSTAIPSDIRTGGRTDAEHAETRRQAPPKQERQISQEDTQQPDGNGSRSTSTGGQQSAFLDTSDMDGQPEQASSGQSGLEPEDLLNFPALFQQIIMRFRMATTEEAYRQVQQEHPMGTGFTVDMRRLYLQEFNAAQRRCAGKH